MKNNIKINKVIFLQNYQIYENSNKKGFKKLKKLFDKKHSKLQ